ncbi:MAG: hypothetical protein MUF42_13680 [Cytophagaceae bacterium]|jgi:hypothetical protein|nr:hypothetical protein [Cytophagaceae bacterium]
MRTCAYSILLVFLLSFQYGWANRQRLSAEVNTIPLRGSNTAWWLDTTCSAKVESFLQGSTGWKSLRFPEKGDMVSENGRPACYWVEIFPDSTWYGTAWLLELSDPHLADVTVWEMPKSQPWRILGYSGYYSPFSTRTIAHKNHVMECQFKAECRYIVRIYAPVKANLSLHLKIVPAFIGYAVQEYFYLGIYYGILVLMLLYNVYLYWYLRERIQLYYIGYVLCCVLHSMNEDGLGFQMIWSESILINKYLYPVVHVSLLFSFLLYSVDFLQLKKKQPFYFRLSWGAALLYSLLFLLGTSMGYYPAVISLLYLLPFVVLYLAAIQAYKQQQLQAGYYLLAYSMLGIGVLIFILRIQDIIPSTIITVYSFNVALLLEVLLMSQALILRMKQLVGEKEIAQRRVIEALKKEETLKSELIIQYKKNEEIQGQVTRELEQKVKERTQELDAARQELEQAYGTLKGYTSNLEVMNSALDKDNWELNKKFFSKIKGETISVEEFFKIFPDDSKCLQFISELKWKDGYACGKCGNVKYSKGEKLYSRKCTKCGYRETATANTLFHSTKFELPKAMYILYHTVEAREDITVDALAMQLSVRVSTCGQFKRKVKDHWQQQASAKVWTDLILLPDS